MDRSVNLESNAFIGSILDGVVNTEEDDAGGAAEAEVAFTLSIKETGKQIVRNLVLVICAAYNKLTFITLARNHIENVSFKDTHELL